MVTVTLTELDLNAIGAALDERNLRLGRELGRLITQPASQSRDFAIDANRQAIQHTIRARLLLASAIEEPEPPEDMTYAEMFAGDHFAGMPARKHIYEAMEDY